MKTMERTRQENATRTALYAVRRWMTNPRNPKYNNGTYAMKGEGGYVVFTAQEIRDMYDLACEIGEEENFRNAWRAMNARLEILSTEESDLEEHRATMDHIYQSK